MSIQPLKNTLKETFKIIGRYQKGEILQIKTNREWLDCHGGITPKSIMAITGASFGGKSTELESLKKDIMDININPNANNFVWLSNAYEMTNFSTTIRDLRKKLNKGKKEILSSEFSEEEKETVKKYYEELSDGRFYINQVPQNAQDFIKGVEDFLEQHTDKELVVLDLDHIGLIKTANGQKKIAVDDVVEGLNELKNKYDNFLVIILSQLNRSILSRIQEKSNESAVRRDDLYQSDTIYHISDYIYALQNANYLKIEEYRKINPDRYLHLSHRFTEEDSKGRVSLTTEGCIFVEILKDRDADINFIDIYTIEIFEPQEKTKLEDISIPTLRPKQTEENDYTDLPNLSVDDAFGVSDDESDNPPF
jgi:hypothetical protein